MSTFIYVKFYSVGGKTHSLELLSTAAGTVDKSDLNCAKHVINYRRWQKGFGVY